MMTIKNDLDAYYWWYFNYINSDYVKFIEKITKKPLLMPYINSMSFKHQNYCRFLNRYFPKNIACELSGYSNKRIKQTVYDLDNDERTEKYINLLTQWEQYKVSLRQMDFAGIIYNI